jgi:hypothetical protein
MLTQLPLEILRIVMCDVVVLLLVECVSHEYRQVVRRVLQDSDDEVANADPDVVYEQGVNWPVCWAYEEAKLEAVTNLVVRLANKHLEVACKAKLFCEHHGMSRVDAHKQAVQIVDGSSHEYQLVTKTHDFNRFECSTCGLSMFNRIDVDGINVDTFLDNGMEWFWNESTFSNHISRMLDSLHDETKAEECFFCNIDVRCAKACRDVTERFDRIKRYIVNGNDYFVRGAVVRVNDTDY